MRSLKKMILYLATVMMVTDPSDLDLEFWSWWDQLSDWEKDQEIGR